MLPLSLYCVCVCICICLWMPDASRDGMLSKVSTCYLDPSLLKQTPTHFHIIHTHPRGHIYKISVLFRSFPFYNLLCHITSIYMHTHTHTQGGITSSLLHKTDKTRYTHPHTRPSPPPLPFSLQHLCCVLLYMKRKSSNYPPSFSSSPP